MKKKNYVALFIFIIFFPILSVHFFFMLEDITAHAQMTADLTYLSLPLKFIQTRNKFPVLFNL